MKKRLLKKINKRLKKRILADWEAVDLQNSNSIQTITNAMTYNWPIQIDYQGSGWRTIFPYGWETSKDGNVLVMCYKDNGEVRSYRYDKILEMFIDDEQTYNNFNTNYVNNDFSDLPQNSNNNESESETDIPLIPVEKEKNNIEPYNESINILETTQPEEFITPTEQVPVSEDNKNDSEQINNEDINNNEDSSKQINNEDVNNGENDSQQIDNENIEQNNNKEINQEPEFEPEQSDNENIKLDNNNDNLEQNNEEEQI